MGFRVQRSHAALPAKLMDQLRWQPGAHRELSKPAAQRLGGESQLLPNQNPDGHSRSGEWEHQTTATTRARLPALELLAAESATAGRYQDRIYCFSESRVECAILQILVQNRKCYVYSLVHQPALAFIFLIVKRQSRGYPNFPYAKADQEQQSYQYDIPFQMFHDVKLRNRWKSMVDNFLSALAKWCTHVGLIHCEKAGYGSSASGVISAVLKTRAVGLGVLALRSVSVIVQKVGLRTLQL